MDDTVVQSMHDLHISRTCSLISTDDPNDLVFFNHVANLLDPEELDMGLMREHIEEERLDVADVADISVENPVPLDTDLVGILLVDIVGAKRLPYEKSTLKTFNCDPFVVISYLKKTFRTKTIKHSQNPIWNESIYLHLKKSDLASDWPLSFTVYDFEKFRKNNAICEVESNLQSLIDGCEKPSRNPNKPTVFPFREMEMDLTIKAIVQDPTKLPYLITHVSYLPYTEIRRNFWFSLMQKYEVEDKIDKVSFVTMLDEIECNFSDETINAMFASVKKSPHEELTFAEAIELLEQKIKPLVGGSSAANPIVETERLMLIKSCPICKKSFDSRRGDFDIVSHLALCSHGNLDKLDQLAMGGFLSEQIASSKWISKIFGYVTFGGVGIGRNSGHILYCDRSTGQLVKEKIPTYIRLGIRLLYQVAGSKSTLESKAIKSLLKRMTMKQGVKFDSPSSVKHIAQFVNYHSIDLSEVADPMESFKSFNQFFYRKLKPGARPLSHENLVCPADARSNVFESIKQSQELWIKGSKFSLETLLDSEQLAHTFRDGSLALFRLAPQDYHRFHWPVDGVLLSSTTIDGTYFTVNPMAIRSAIDVYSENVRNVAIIETAHGKLAYVSVGAMLVGSVVITAQVGQTYSKGDEMGYFKFGGSTIILICEKNRSTFDADLLANSKTSLETLVKMGSSLGRLM